MMTPECSWPPNAKKLRNGRVTVVTREKNRRKARTIPQVGNGSYRSSDRGWPCHSYPHDYMIYRLHMYARILVVDCRAADLRIPASGDLRVGNLQFRDVMALRGLRVEACADLGLPQEEGLSCEADCRRGVAEACVLVCAHAATQMPSISTGSGRALVVLDRMHSSVLGRPCALQDEE